MKNVFKALSAFAVIALTATVLMAEDAPSTTSKPAEGDKPAAVKGSVVKVDGVKITVKTSGDAPAEVVVTTDDKTKVSIDGQDGMKVSDLVAGMSISVKPADGVAKKIAAKTPKPPKAPKQPKDPGTGAPESKLP